MPDCSTPTHAALLAAHEALCVLAEHPAFADSAPEFNEGGIGYEAIQTLKQALGNLRT